MQSAQFSKKTNIWFIRDTNFHVIVRSKSFFLKNKNAVNSFEYDISLRKLLENMRTRQRLVFKTNPLNKSSIVLNDFTGSTKILFLSLYPRLKQIKERDKISNIIIVI